MPAETLRTTPFFIVGNPRSGTTLLRTLLCGHSRLYIPDETGFLAHLSKYQTRSLARDEVKRLVEEIGTMNHEWSDLVDDVDQFCASLSSLTLCCALDGLYRLKIQSQGAARWGDKGPSYVRVIPAIDRIFPTAQFIHLIRDGRDCVLSALHKWGDRYWYYDSFYLLQTWKRNVMQGRASAEWLGPERYLEIRYEQLVAETESTVRRVCEFLNEPFEPSMLEHTLAGQQISVLTGHHEVASPVTRRTVENWKSKMDEFDQQLANRIAGAQLADLGYEVPRLPAMSISERWRLARMATRYYVVDGARKLLFATGWLKMSREKSRAATKSITASGPG